MTMMQTTAARQCRVLHQHRPKSLTKNKSTAIVGSAFHTANGTIIGNGNLSSYLVNGTEMHKITSFSTSSTATIARRPFSSQSNANSSSYIPAIASASLLKNNVTKNNYIMTRSMSSAMPSSSSSMGEEPAVISTDVNGPNTSPSPPSSSDKKKTHKRLSDVPISEVLQAKHSLKWTEPVISHKATIREAIQVCIENGLSGMMVIDTSESSESSTDTTTTNNTINIDDKSYTGGKVIGMSTSRDLLRIINGGIQESKSAEHILSLTVSEFMTPISKVIYARPEETIGMCRSIMAKLGIKCLPILSNGRVEGLITSRDMSQYGLNATERGGKKHFLESVSERVGMGSNTSMAEPPTYLQAHVNTSKNLKRSGLYTNVGVSELPHPFKKPEGCGMNRRDFGPDEVGDDVSLSEDAFFVTKLKLPPETKGDGNEGENTAEMRDIVYCGVADGVGSWREYSVDPREFSHRLMQESENILREEACTYNKTCKKKIKKDGGVVRRIITPAEVMAQAYDRVKADNVIGSSTACVALFDGSRHQVHFSNLGDSGLIVLRHIDSNIAGALKREKRIPREKRTSDLRVAFVSQQQLRSFNHPFQLGWTGEEAPEGQDAPFETAAESCTTSIHVRRGDIVIMATDGLFDNVELEDIEKIALEWEQKCGFIQEGDISAREKRWAKGSSMTLESAERVDELTRALVEKARENSLDNTKDSPFAILAKENDVMWSGGMPDDCTVLAMHIVGAPSDA